MWDSRVGSANIFSSSTGTNQFAIVAGVPASGTIFVRLWTLLPGGWAFHDYTYVGGVTTAAAITTPTPGTTLAGSTATFGWNAGSGIIQYFLYVGTAGVGSNNIFSSSTVPLNRRLSLASDRWDHLRAAVVTDFHWLAVPRLHLHGWCRAAGCADDPVAGYDAQRLFELFRWNSGHGASQYYLYVGTAGVGSANIYAASAGTNLSAAVTGIPTSGTIYVRLWTLLPRAGRSATTPIRVGMRRRSRCRRGHDAERLRGDVWLECRHPGATQYWLYVGTTGVGSANIYSNSAGLALSAGVTGIPTSGTIYVRLWTFVDSWRWNDYTYTAAGRRR